MFFIFVSFHSTTNLCRLWSSFAPFDCHPWSSFVIEFGPLVDRGRHSFARRGWSRFILVAIHLVCDHCRTRRRPCCHLRRLPRRRSFWSSLLQAASGDEWNFLILKLQLVSLYDFIRNWNFYCFIQKRNILMLLYSCKWFLLKIILFY